ncbi:MAG TPA: hypothetical protein VMV10_06500 [Pirellulales bacterium]|nr:hypothetical protein [Pirellulales bacterium]
MAVASDDALRFLKAGKAFDGQRRQRRTFDFLKDLADLSLRRAMNPRVGDGRFPMFQESLLFVEAGERAAFQGVVFDVLDSRLDLPLVPGHVGPGRQDQRAVVPAERLHLRREFGIEPVGMRDGRLQVVDHQRLGRAAKMSEGVLQATDEIFRRLAKRRFAVALPRMAEHDAEDIRLAPLALGADDRRARAEVDLGLFARRRFQTTERRDGRGAQRTHEAFHAVVSGLEAVLGDQVLPDPLGRKPLCELGQNQLAVRFAFATPAGLRGVLATRRGV